MLKKMEFQSGIPEEEVFWCPHHNNGSGMWTLHHPKDCKANNKDNDSSPRANMVTFDTVDSDSE